MPSYIEMKSLKLESGWKRKIKTFSQKNLHKPQVTLHVRPKNWQSVSGDFIIHSQIFKSEQFSYLDIPIDRKDCNFSLPDLVLLFESMTSIVGG